MKKILYILCVLCIVNSSAFSLAPSISQIAGIERQLFGYEYKNDIESKRLNRIEEYLYGKTYTSPTPKRLEKISNDIGFLPEQSTASSGDTNKNKKIASSQTPQQVYEKEDATVQYPIVDKIEDSVFSRSYNGENIYSRVERLEKKVFGKSVNDNLSNRVNKLRLAVLDNADSDGFITGSAMPAIPTENYYDSISSAYDDDVIDSYNKSRAMSKTQDFDPFKYNNVSPMISRNNNLALEISTIEQSIFKQTFTGESIDKRLERIETQLFKRNFYKDNPSMRLQRIAAANTAQKSSKMYDNNKLMRNLSTGMQVGTILLMIFAMIL